MDAMVGILLRIIIRNYPIFGAQPAKSVRKKAVFVQVRDYWFFLLALGEESRDSAFI